MKTYSMMKKTVLATLLMAAAGQAMAAESVNIKVRGQFVPAACNLAVDGGGTVDYGRIKAQDITKDDFTMLSVKTIGLNITCGAPTKIALRTTDMRSGSAVPLYGKTWDVTGHLFGYSNTSKVLGLGKDGDKNIGAWAMWMEPDSIRADGNTVDPIQLKPDIIPLGSNADDSTLLWSVTSSGSLWLSQTGDNYSSWAATGTFIPLAIQNLTGTLSVQAGINKGSELDLTKTVTLDGLATLQVYYL